MFSRYVVPRIVGGGTRCNAGDQLAINVASHPGGIEILPVASFLRNRAGYVSSYGSVSQELNHGILSFFGQDTKCANR